MGDERHQLHHPHGEQFCGGDFHRENGNEVTSTETVTETILEITITHKSPEEMAQQYSLMTVR